MRRRSLKRAFTLIEILVVVAIIALLIAILLPSLSRAREQARNSMCKSNTKQLLYGQAFYIADHGHLPATHSVFYQQSPPCWPIPAGLTWEGARGGTSYAQPYDSDPVYVEDVPRKGTIFRYTKNEEVYLCPSDKPGQAEATPLGGGGNGRLSYSMNAYVGYKRPERLLSFTYGVAATLMLPGGRTRTFNAGERVVYTDSAFMLLFEEHPRFHINYGYPEGNFNVSDRIVTRHSPARSLNNPEARGRTNIGFLDTHVESRLYPAKTPATQLFAELGQPYSGVNLDAFVVDLQGVCP